MAIMWNNMLNIKRDILGGQSMKGIFFITSLLIIASLMGCATNVQTGSIDKTNKQNGIIGKNGADFRGIILEVNESSITVGADNIDPEASYPAYEVFVNNQKRIEEAVNGFSKLKVDQKVEIWVKGKWNNDPNNKMVASKIIIKK